MPLFSCGLWLCVCMSVCMCLSQGVKGSSVLPVDRIISVSPSCQPAIIDVSVCLYVWLDVCMSVCLSVCMSLCMCLSQGVKGSSVLPVDRLISVSPSCQPAIIEVSYVNNDGQKMCVESNQDVVGVCGDNIRHISESLIDSFSHFFASGFCFLISKCTYAYSSAGHICLPFSSSVAVASLTEMVRRCWSKFSHVPCDIIQCHIASM